MHVHEDPRGLVAARSHREIPNDDARRQGPVDDSIDAFIGLRMQLWDRADIASQLPYGAEYEAEQRPQGWE